MSSGPRPTSVPSGILMYPTQLLHGDAQWRNLVNMTEPSMFGGHAKTAEPIEMPFGMWTRVGPGNHVLDGVKITTCQEAIFRGKDMTGHAR